MEHLLGDTLLFNPD